MKLSTRSAGLRLSDDLRLPMEAITEKFAIVGRSGSGKTSTGTVLAEEIIETGTPVVVVDPTGAWWGLRSSADGKGAGLPVVIFGGDHADVPLGGGIDDADKIPAKAGAAVADAIVDSRFPAILDLSHMDDDVMVQFMTDFARRLYLRNRDPLHLILDEADVFVPQQRLTKDGTALFKAINNIVRRGRIRGFGVTLISQRPAVISWDVLSQTGVLVALELKSHHDIAAIEKWVSSRATGDEVKQITSSLASLPVGTGWVWSPGALDILEKVSIRPRRTFDSSATPKPGQTRAIAQSFAPVDTVSLGNQIAELTREAQSSDPEVLRDEIAHLKRELAAAGDGAAPKTGKRTCKKTKDAAVEQTIEKIVEVPVPVLTDEQAALLAKATETIREYAANASTRAEQAAGRIKEQVDQLGDTLAALSTAGRTDSESVPKAAAKKPGSTRASSQPSKSSKPRRSNKQTQAQLSAGQEAGEIRLGKTEHKVLSTLILHGPMGHDMLALLAGYSAKASTVGVALAKLRRSGLVEPSEKGQPNSATAAGVALLDGDLAPLPSGAELLEYWRTRFGLTEQRVLDAVLEVYPEATSQAEVAELTGYSPTASTIGVALSRLRKVGVIEGWRISHDFALAVGLENVG